MFTYYEMLKEKNEEGQMRRAVKSDNSSRKMCSNQL